MVNWLLVMVAVPAIGTAQSPLPFEDPLGQSTSTEVQIGGRSSMDLIRLHSGRASFPLRFANVRLGSERIEINGRPAIKGTDYTIDYASGVIYVLKPFNDGDTLRAQYKYDAAATQTGIFAPKSADGSGFSGLRLDFNRSSSLFLGLGMTERLGDGTVLSSNTYGIANNYRMGGGALRGVFMVGERARSEAVSLLGDYASGRRQNDEGTGTAIVQNLQSQAYGGKISLDYQDVDTKFAGFEALKQNGLSGEETEAIRKERGLKRSAFTANGLDFNGLKLSSGFKSLGDADGSIDWRSFGASLGGLSLKYDSQGVDKSFARFNDIREADRAQLMNERGTDRESLSASIASGGSNLAFKSFGLRDTNDQGVSRSSYAIASQGMSLNYSTQTIDRGFTQFKAIRPEDAQGQKFDVGQLQREQGLDRSLLQFASKLRAGELKFTSSSVEEGKSGIEAQDVSIKVGKATIEHREIDSDAGFQRFASLAPQEQQDTVKSVVDIVAPGGGLQGNDVGLFTQNPGIDRALWRLNYDFGGGTSLKASTSSVSGAKDDASLQGFGLTGTNYYFNYRSLEVGREFVEGNRLLANEQAVYGTISDLAKTEMAMGYSFNKETALSFEQSNIDVQGSEAARRKIGYKGKCFDVNWSRRSVDDGFVAPGRMNDPEQTLLTGLAGFEQEALVAKMQLLPTLNAAINWSSAHNAATQETRAYRDSALKYNLTESTTLSAQRIESLEHDENGAMVDREFDRLMVEHNLGRLGIVSLLQETKSFDGDEDTAPDSVKFQVGYKTDISKTTKIETENSETVFNNGLRETATTNTVTTQVTDRVGVSVTDTKIQRDGDQKDSSKRDYGIWLDFGKNVRLSYGVARNLMDPNNGTRTMSSGLTAGQFGGIDVKSLQYSQNVWEGQRNSTSGNVNIKTLKPLDLGTVENVEFFYLVDTQFETGKWQRENRSMGVSGNLGLVSLGFGYRSQITPAGDRAIDRVLSLNTDTSGKSSIRAELNYDLRTMPDDTTVAIRDLKFVAQPFKNWQIEHSMKTNPIRQDNNVLLGGIAQDTRVNNWRINCLADPDTKGGFVFEELINDRTNTMTRKTGLDVTLFARNPSPLTLGYRATLNGSSNTHTTAHEFWLRFDQRPGPNQSLSLMLGNLNYEGLRPSGRDLQNWSMRLDYGFKF